MPPKKKEETIEENAQEQVNEPTSFTVYKKQNDPQSFVCGVKVETDPDGREFFNLPASAREFVESNPNLIWPAE